MKFGMFSTLFEMILEQKRTMVTFAVALALVAGTVGIGVRVAFPPEREVWFDNLLKLAVDADAEYDASLADVKADEPRTWSELYSLVREIVYQIADEKATKQIVPPRDVGFMDFGYPTRSAVAGMYFPEFGVVVLNERYLTPSWGETEWLSVLVHELVHSQGYFVGSSSTLESQTEATSKEVLAAMANLGYPGARSAFLDDLRRSALSMAYYIAHFGGRPEHTTYTDDVPGGFAAEDVNMVLRWQETRKAVYTKAELTRSDARLRFWNAHPAEYVSVLYRYVVKTTTIELDAGCAVGNRAAESFQQYPFKGFNKRGLPMWDLKNQIKLPPLVFDDFGYILHQLGYC